MSWPGRGVLAGEPVARLKGEGAVYWELRLGGEPVDPSPYLERALAEAR